MFLLIKVLPPLIKVVSPLIKVVSPLIKMVSPLIKVVSPLIKVRPLIKVLYYNDWLVGATRNQLKGIWCRSLLTTLHCKRQSQSILAQLLHHTSYHREMPRRNLTSQNPLGCYR